jgi:transitional endoplasmic reticulum ATPase
MHPYERWTLRCHLANALRSTRLARPPRADSDIVGWIESNSRPLGLAQLASTVVPSGRRGTIAASIPSTTWRAWRADAIRTSREPAPQASPLQKRLDWLAEACSLTDSQSQVLGLLARATQPSQLCNLIEALNGRFGACLEGVDESDLLPFLKTRSESRELSEAGRLAELGLIEARETKRLSPVVRRLLSLPQFNARRVGHLLLGEPARASLSWNQFEHLGDLRDIAARIVAASVRSRGSSCRGANVLFYGPPGTGKSEFAKALGAKVGFSVHFCGETDDENAEPNRRDRIAALLIANAIGRVARRTIVVVDEADDLLFDLDDDGAFGRRGSKVFMNRLLERTVAPTIWIVNDIDRLGPSIIRRMNLALRFPKPTLSARKSMIARIATHADLRLQDSEMLDLARAPAPPALIENAILCAKHIRGAATDAHMILDSGLRALGRREISKEASPIRFDPALSSADVDLAQLANQVSRSAARTLSFCLSGPPGTGKSAYARHLAERLDLDVLEKRFSDLSSMWLGESEKAIALAFEEAADLRAFLIFDEADSLLRDRFAAHHSWEVTQVNEMLTQMERHPYPFACTTNAAELLDAAAARRFLFKVRFLPMSPDQVAKAYRRAFNFEPPSFVLKLSGLTPADFATVLRKAAALGERDPRTFGRWLEYEALAKPDAGRQKIGF